MHSAQPSTPRIGRRLFAILAVLLVIPAHGNVVGATDGGPVVSIGESNNEAQREQVLDFLDATASDRVVTISVDETIQSMEGLFDVSGIDTAFSSTALRCQAAQSGIEVTTRNIEVIPPELYALALLTAGMSDVQLDVAAPDDAPALGMTALTGVFMTWDMASCGGFGGDPVRHQFALEQLALIAEIGQDPETVRQTTLVVLDAQQEITGTQPTTGKLDAIVAARAEAAGLDLGDSDREAIVAFLDRLARAGIDWADFAHGWSMQPADAGRGVVLRANADPAPVDVSTPVPTGVGGVTGPIRVAATPAVPASPIATEATPVVALADSIPASGGDSSTTFIGTVTERGREAGRWWPVAAGIGALLLLGVGARLKPSETVTTWRVSRRRNLWLGRTLRRPPIVQSPRPRRGYAIVTRKR